MSKPTSMADQSPKSVMHDERKIFSIRMASDSNARCSNYDVGYADVSKIEVVKECGEMSNVPWFLVHYADGRNLVRINGKYVVEVSYVLN